VDADAVPVSEASPEFCAAADASVQATKTGTKENKRRICLFDEMLAI
jgi:hypothetical protein